MLKQCHIRHLNQLSGLRRAAIEPLVPLPHFQ